MFKKFVLKLFLVSGALPLFLHAMEAPNNYKEKLFEILDISGPLKRDDYQKLRDFARLLAWQEEVMLVIDSILAKGATSLDREKEQIDFVKQSNFVKAIWVEDSYHFVAIYDEIDSAFAASVFLRYKDFMAKSEDFSQEDKLLADKLTASSNDEIRFIGEFKKMAIKESAASHEYYMTVNNLGRKLLNFKNKLAQISIETRNEIQPLLRTIEFISRIKHAEGTTENQMKAYSFSKKIYEDLYSKNNLDELYQTARQILNEHSDAQRLLTYENLEQKESLLPTSLELFQQDEPSSSKEELKPSKKKPARKKKKSAAAKGKRSRKKIKTKKVTIEPKETQLEPEIIQEPLEQEFKSKEQDLIAWYNNQFPRDDGSSVSEINNFQIAIDDPKNNVEIILFRKSQDDEKIISSPLNYDARVKRWFDNPEQALEEDGYTQKYQSAQKLKEFEARHNFAKITDAFLDKEGVNSQYIDKYGREIPVKLLAGEMRLAHPDGTINKISGIFSYGKDPRENRYYHRYFSDKEYKDIVSEYYADSKWEVEFPPLS